MSGPIRVLIVDDSLTVRKRLCEVLAADAQFEVVGEAVDGKQAIEICQRVRPDVISMDIVLPVMSGLAATEYIMAYCPTPILVVSAAANRGELFNTYEALAAGAVDVLEKPHGDEADGAWEQKLLSSLRIVSRIPVITHIRGKLASGRVANDSPLDSGRTAALPQVVAIGASTGGPGAIMDILRSLPSNFELPILLVIHLSKPFERAFADWLNGLTERTVRRAIDGESVSGLSRTVVMAPSDRHMLVRQGRLWLSSAPERHSCRPSVDVLFETVASEYGPAALACLLTGMGRDGAAGLLKVRLSGGTTLAQDEATSVVYGMPREAALLGAAQKILPLNEIGPALVALSKGICR